jgi:ABC-type glycerol-3-phosphate transport system substrate-binding protein
VILHNLQASEPLHIFAKRGLDPPPLEPDEPPTAATADVNSVLSTAPPWFLHHNDGNKIDFAQTSSSSFQLFLRSSSGSGDDAATAIEPNSNSERIALKQRHQKRSNPRRGAAAGSLQPEEVLASYANFEFLSTWNMTEEAEGDVGTATEMTDDQLRSLGFPVPPSPASPPLMTARGGRRPLGSVVDNPFIHFVSRKYIVTAPPPPPVKNY